MVFAYASGNLANTLLPTVLLSWVLYFYCPPEGKGALLLTAGLVGAIRAGERILGWVIEPLVGYLSDRTRTRFGRRMPWIALGAPVLCVSFSLIWFPPRGRPTDDVWVAVHFGACLTLFWAAYTSVVAPYLALLPELGKSRDARLSLSLWLAVFEVIANIGASIGAGQMVGLGSMVVLGLALDNGYQLTGLVIGGVSLLFYLIVVLGVREPPRTAQHDVHFSLREAAQHCLKNPMFVPYAAGVAGFRLAASAAVIAVPYLSTVLMGTDEETAGYMLAVIIIIALFAFPLVQRLSARFGSARVFSWGGLALVLVLPLMGTIGWVPGVPPLAHGLVLFVLSGFSVATLLVLPRTLLAEVIDLDAERTGFRREAIYNGMGGVVEKAGEAVALLMIGVLFDRFGNSAGHDLGLRLLGTGSAVGLLVGMLVFARYPRRSGS